MNAIPMSNQKTTELKISSADLPPLGSAPRARMTPKKSRKKHILGIGLLALIAGGAFGAHWWWTTGRFLETTDNAYVEADISPISPQIDGFIASVEVGDNQSVKRGDVLVRIDDSDFRARLDRATAAVETAKGTIATS